MPRKAKYFIEYNGEEITLYEYAKRIGVHPQTLRNRLETGRPLDAPVREYAEDDPMTEEKRRRKDKFGYLNGYTKEELCEIYSHFAGNEDELRILMDFTGMGIIYAEKLLEELKIEREKRRRIS